MTEPFGPDAGLPPHSPPPQPDAPPPGPDFTQPKYLIGLGIGAAIVLIAWAQLAPRPAALPSAETIANVAHLEPTVATTLRTPLPELLATLQPATFRDSSASAEAWIQQPFGAALAGNLTIAWTGGPACAGAGMGSTGRGR